MADKNNLTTLAKRLRPLLGSWVNNLAGQTVEEGPGIDIVKTGDVNTVGLGGDSFLLYDDETAAPVAEFATLTLALAAAVSGQVVITPNGVYTEDVTIPAGIGVRSIGNRTIIIGTITFTGPTGFLKSMIVQPTVNSAGAIIGVVGPSVFGADLACYINDCTILVTNNGAGDAIAVQVDNGDLLIWNSICKAYANAGGDAFGIYGAVDTTGICNSEDAEIYALAVGGGVGHGAATDGIADFWIWGGKIIATTTPIRM